jgi:multidrug transporter EmrE-like cation transporter
VKLLLAMAPTVLLVVYSQLITKWRVQSVPPDAVPASGALDRLAGYLSDPLILSSYLTALAGSVAWMFVVERYAISLAFPVYIGLTVMFVVIGGAVLFGEELPLSRIIAVLLIVAGVALASRS